MGIYRGTGGTGDSTTDATITEVTQQATNAAQSASDAANSATSAANSASTATTKAGEASTSATTATGKAGEASTSALAAATSYDNFDDRYLGAKDSNPVVDNDGDALLTGALYFNTTNNTLRVYNGSVWQTSLTEIVTDTTPQLGGNLDLNSNNITGTGDINITGNVSLTGTVDGRDVADDGTKLDGIETGATADQTAAEIRTLVESATDSNVFTDDDHTKLDGIESGATADQTAEEIKSAYESNSDTNAFTDAEQTKLSGIETNATADQTAAEIKSAYESNSDTNAFTDAEQTKLSGIETNATADQTDAEIKTAYENNSDTNAFTDAEQTKLSGIEINADVTDSDNVTAAGALMDSEVTNLQQVKDFDSSDYATAAQGTTADSALQNVSEDTTPQLGGGLDLNSNNITGTGNIDVTGTVTSQGVTVEPTDAHAIVSLQNTTTNTFGDSRSYHEIQWDAKDLGGADVTYAELKGQTVATGSRGQLHLNVKGASGLTTYITLDGDDQNIKALKNVDVTGNIDVSGDAIIGGNLTVSGTTTSVNTETINLADNLITLNSNETGTPSQNAGIEVERGTSTNKIFQWNETSDYWETDDDLNVAGNITLSGTVDGRDLVNDGTKLDNIEANADVTDTDNVTAAGALMDSEVTNLQQVKDFDSSDYATAAQGTTADSALQDGDTVSSLTITSADINSGTIDNTTIGASTAVAGTFTSLKGNDLIVDATTDHSIFSLRNTVTNTFGDSRSYHEIRWEAKDLVGSDVIYGEIEGRTYASGSKGRLNFNVKDSGGLTTYLALDGNNSKISAFENFDVTGNITVSGTVDGRDIATDGGKLDGIESGATADQTASEILTAIKTVDGSGSGLDADTLDGIQGANFVRSDTSDTMSGSLRVTSSITAGLSYTPTGAGALSIASTGSPYFSFHNSSGTRLGYHQYVTGSNYLFIYNELAGDIRLRGNAASSYTYFQNSAGNGGRLFVNGQDFSMQHDNGENIVYGRENQNTWLYYNGQWKFRTQANGIDIRNEASTYSEIRMTTGSNADTRGYFYANTSNQIGILDTGGNWVVRATNDVDVDFFVNDTEKFSIGTSSTTSANDITINSDERIKDNIEQIPDALEKVQAIRGVTFNRTDTDDDTRHAGVIAQEVEKVLPEVVTENEETGIKSVAYANMVGLLIEAIKEQQTQIDDLKAEVTRLKGFE